MRVTSLFSTLEKNTSEYGNEINTKQFIEDPWHSLERRRARFANVEMFVLHVDVSTHHSWMYQIPVPKYSFILQRNSSEINILSRFGANNYTFEGKKYYISINLI